jgi:mannose-6-phosphate isomerase-like protein (cupin superfamily)
VFRTLAAGTYRVRATHQAFIALEKEITVRPGVSISVEFALSAAPPPPEPPPPPPAPRPPPPPAAPVAPSPPAGEARIIAIPEVAERSLGGREPVRIVPLGCSGLTNAQLLVVHEGRQSPARADIDETLYVVAGEAMLNIGGKEQVITSGWFGLVPRGTPHSVTRRGRNPAILLSIAGGQPCAPAR